jgi:hypothetical protein
MYSATLKWVLVSRYASVQEAENKWNSSAIRKFDR